VSADPARAGLDARLLDWMRKKTWRRDDARFEALALELFAFQYAHCAAYRRFCDGRGRTPASVRAWTEIPAVPTGAFKEVVLTSFPPERAVHVFRTSGTTTRTRGSLHLDTLDLYEASLLPTFRRHLLPEHAPGERVRFVVVAPSPEEAPDSSLSHMFGVLLGAIGSARSGYDVIGGELGAESLIEQVEACRLTGEPIALLGTAFAFVHLLEHLEAGGSKLACPPGSRLMETGGFKGRAREMPRKELYDWLSNRLGVPQTRIVNQYGMTELGSQFYDSVLVDPEGPRRKLGPPWARVRFIDPETGADVKEGEVGMVVIHDLANTGSVAALETADLGRRVLDEGGRPIGFEVLGRDPDAEARGCSIAADAMLAGLR